MSSQGAGAVKAKTATALTTRRTTAPRPSDDPSHSLSTRNPKQVPRTLEDPTVSTSILADDAFDQGSNATTATSGYDGHLSSKLERGAKQDGPRNDQWLVL